MINRHTSFGAAVLMGFAVLAGPGRLANTVQAAGEEANASAKPVPPIVFQAAGPTIASIQSMVDAFRAALGGVNNGSVAGPLVEGRREINWDGGGSTATSLVPTPFDGFLVSRGGRFTTPGSGFVQAPVEGLVDVFRNKQVRHDLSGVQPGPALQPHRQLRHQRPVLRAGRWSAAGDDPRIRRHLLGRGSRRWPVATTATSPAAR